MRLYFMNKAQKLIKLLEDNQDPSFQKDVDADQQSRSALDKFLEPSEADREQDAAIEKFRLKKQLRYMKKFQNNPENDKDGVKPGKDREYYWDANVSRVSGA